LAAWAEGLSGEGEDWARAAPAAPMIKTAIRYGKNFKALELWRRGDRI
jgi:hypothetical protein